MTIEVVQASTWGSGHGATRHLVDHGTYALSPELGPRSRCAGGRYRLDLLEADVTRSNDSERDGTASVREVVRAKKACRSCAGFAYRFGVRVEEEMSHADERGTTIVEYLSRPDGAQGIHAVLDWLRANGHRAGWETVRHDLDVLTGQDRIERVSTSCGLLWAATSYPAAEDHDPAALGAATETARNPCAAVFPVGGTL